MTILNWLVSGQIVENLKSKWVIMIGKNVSNPGHNSMEGNKSDSSWNIRSVWLYGLQTISYFCRAVSFSLLGKPVRAMHNLLWENAIWIFCKNDASTKF